MNVIGLDDKEYKMSLKNRGTSKSKLHSSALDLVKDIFPFDPIYEDVTLPGSKSMSRKSLLYVDIFLPKRDLMIEVHGEQHFKYNSHFYKDKFSFYRAQARDRDKAEWCFRNDICLVELSFNNKEEWRNLIVNR